MIIAIVKEDQGIGPNIADGLALSVLPVLPSAAGSA
jgi:hypothetical protein